MSADMAIQSVASLRYGIISACAFSLIALSFFLWTPASKLKSLEVGSIEEAATDIDLSGSDVYNETLGFQRILYVNLPARTDRRDALTLTSAFTGLKFERIEGVLGQLVSEKTFPPGAKDGLATDGQRGSWRGHLNAIERVVAEGWGSALILEDDVDWDIRLKDQMLDLAQGLQLLSKAGPKAEGELDLRSRQKEPTIAGNPYGNDWDVLWIGHCGSQWPNKKIFKHLPQARAVLLDDPTVPETQHIQWEWGSKYLGEHYPNHTRVYHHTADVLCSLGYAITQSAARQLLWQISLKETTDPFDIALRQYCDGHGDRPVRRCFTTQPTLFGHHRPVRFASRVSDISNNGNEEQDWRDTATTANIRQAVRVNLNRLVNDETELLDQWPDQE